MRNIKMTKILAAIVSLFIFMSLSMSSFAVTKTLSLYFERQQKSNWCWAATSQCIIDKIAGRRPTQTQIVTNIWGSDVNYTVSPDRDMQSLSAWGVGSYRTSPYAPIGFAVVKWDIDASKPLKATISWTSGGGHDYVINGYYENGTDQQIYYLDPWPSNPLL